MDIIEMKLECLKLAEKDPATNDVMALAAQYWDFISGSGQRAPGQNSSPSQDNAR